MYIEGRKIEHFVFDWDGTVFSYTDANSSIDSEGKVLDYIAKKIPEFKHERIHNLFQESMDVDRSIWFENFLKKIGYQEQVGSKIKVLAKDLETLYWTSFAQLNKPYQDCLYFIERIRNHCSLGVITDGYIYNQKIKYFSAGLYNYFDLEKVVFSDEVGIKKPDIKIFDYAQKKIGFNPKTTCYIGDIPQKDVVGANSAGLYSILLKRGRNYYQPLSKNETPNLEVSNFYELLSLIDF